MNKYEVDQWVVDNEEDDAYRLLDNKLPGVRRKLDKLDKQISGMLAEIKKVFPDACYYTASGGFNLLLGPSHENTHNCPPQRQRQAWDGDALIGDGDW